MTWRLFLFIKNKLLPAVYDRCLGRVVFINTALVLTLPLSLDSSVLAITKLVSAVICKVLTTVYIILDSSTVVLHNFLTENGFLTMIHVNSCQCLLINNILRLLCSVTQYGDVLVFPTPWQGHIQLAMGKHLSVLQCNTWNFDCLAWKKS